MREGEASWFDRLTMRRPAGPPPRQPRAPSRHPLVLSPSKDARRPLVQSHHPLVLSPSKDPREPLVLSLSKDGGRSAA